MESQKLITYRRPKGNIVSQMYLSAFCGRYADRLRKSHGDIEIIDENLDTKLTTEEMAALVAACKVHGFMLPEKYLAPVPEPPALDFDPAADLASDEPTPAPAKKTRKTKTA